MVLDAYHNKTASNCYQETVRKDVFFPFLNPSNVKVLENLNTIVSLLNSRRSHLKFCKFQGKLNRYVPLNNLTANFVAFFVVSGTALSIISWTSSVLNSQNLLFGYIFFLHETWLPVKNFLSSGFRRIHFHMRSNAGIMADNRDLVNQSKS